MKFVNKECAIKDFIWYRDRVIRIDADRRVRGLEKAMDSEELNRYRPNYLRVYFDDLYLRVSDGYHAILLFDSPSESPVFKNMYNETCKIDEQINFGPAAISLDGSLPPFVVSNVENSDVWYIYSLQEGRRLSSMTTKKAMLEECQYNFDWDVRKEQFLSCYDSEGSELWRIDFEGSFRFRLNEQKEGVRSLLGEYAGLLWVLLQSGKVLGIRYQNGEIVKEIGVDTEVVPERVRDDYVPGGYIAGSEYLQLDRMRGEIRGLSGSSIYSQIDLNDAAPTRHMKDVKDSMQEFGFDGLTRYFAGDERIYFCGRHDQDKNLAVFDRRRQEVIWSDIKTPISPERGHTKKIVVRDNRLYLLDFNDDLYTFDLDSNGL